MPLGNGILGALVWGDGNPLNISLDRTDVWDCRPVIEFDDPDCNYRTMRQWHETGHHDDLIRIFEEPYNRAAPTKIPVGRIELSFAEPAVFASTDLDIRAAAASVAFADSTRVEVTVHGTEPLGWISVNAPSSVTARLVAPAFGGAVEEGSKENPFSAGDLRRLGYLPPVESSGPNWVAYSQQGWGDFHFAVYLAWAQEDGGGWKAVWSIATSSEGAVPLDIARERVAAAMKRSTEALAADHRAWWEEYWSKSSVRVPNSIIERQWYLDQYKFGASSRRGAPPITLQGPWTADNGEIPPWKGDYHNDLNTQLSYWSCYSANHLDEGLSYLDWLWDTRDNCKRWTRKFFDMDGLNVPGVADLANLPIGGWRQYSFSSTTAAWLAQHFYLHWRYSLDREFLRDRAYPYLKDCSTFIAALTANKDEAGKRTLPLSSSPEIYANSPAAWFPNFTNYDLALSRWLFGATAELADELQLENDSSHWREMLAELPELAIGEDGALLVAPGLPLPDTHRHLSHTMAIHPLGLIKSEHGEAARQTIEASLDGHERAGVGDWCGYTYAWLANHRARLGDGSRAERALEIFSTAFTLRSSFHCNGDTTGLGYSDWTYKPMTLEGNFAAAAGLQEMLLQSHNDVIAVFPAIPENWKDATFTDLRAEGAFLVSAELREGRLHSLTVRAEADGQCRLLVVPGGKYYSRTLQAGEQWRII